MICLGGVDHELGELQWCYARFIFPPYWWFVFIMLDRNAQEMHPVFNTLDCQSGLTDSRGRCKSRLQLSNKCGWRPQEALRSRVSGQFLVIEDHIAGEEQLIWRLLGLSMTNMLYTMDMVLHCICVCLASMPSAHTLAKTTSTWPTYPHHRIHDTSYLTQIDKWRCIWERIHFYWPDPSWTPSPQKAGRCRQLWCISDYHGKL